MTEKEIRSEYRRSVQSVGASDAFRERVFARMQEEAEKAPAAPPIKINKYITSAAALAACAAIAVAMWSNSSNQLATTTVSEKDAAEPVDIMTAAAVAEDTYDYEDSADKEAFPLTEAAAAEEEVEEAAVLTTVTEITVNEILPENTLRIYEEEVEEAEDEDNAEVTQAAVKDPESKEKSGEEKKDSRENGKSTKRSSSADKTKEKRGAAPDEGVRTEGASAAVPAFAGIVGNETPVTGEQDNTAVFAAPSDADSYGAAEQTEVPVEKVEGEFGGYGTFSHAEDSYNSGEEYEEDAAGGIIGEESVTFSVTAEIPVMETYNFSPARIRRSFKNCAATVTDVASSGTSSSLDIEESQKLLKAMTNADNASVTISSEAPVDYSYIVDISKENETLRLYISGSTVTYRTADERGIIYVSFVVKDTKALAGRLAG